MQCEAAPARPDATDAAVLPVRTLVPGSHSVFVLVHSLTGATVAHKGSCLERAWHHHAPSTPQLVRCPFCPRASARCTASGGGLLGLPRLPGRLPAARSLPATPAAPIHVGMSPSNCDT